MKYTLCLTRQCNLDCTYCYIGKQQTRMSPVVARKIVDFIFALTPAREKMDIGFFGGEPLLEFELIRTITEMIESHPDFGAHPVDLAIVTNGTIFSEAIAAFVKAHNVGFTISCDGPPAVQDRFRHFRNGSGSSAVVSRTIRQAMEAFSLVPVNAVYGPATVRALSQTVAYLSALGVRQIYLSPDFSASWTGAEAGLLPQIYGQVAEQYIRHYLSHDPHFISLIDSKIAVMLRGGYDPRERCHMGTREFAFAPDGKIYPCERLIGSGGSDHCIGHIDEGLRIEGLFCHGADGDSPNAECVSCGIKDYCMNWCGCSNYFSSGSYRRVGPFLCASEKAATATALHVFQTLEGTAGISFADHVGGFPITNSNHLLRRR